MEEFAPDSYCGLFCGACEIMSAYRRSLRTGIPPAWEDLPETLRDNIGEAEIRCRGCKSDTVFSGCARCDVRACARKKGVDYCVHCADYPCATIRAMERDLAGLSERMPHTKAIIANLSVIGRIGGERWIRAERERWSCGHCGHPTTWYATVCEACGRRLGEG